MELRRLLCTHITPVKIGRNGVQFQYSGARYVYRGEGISLRRGEMVLAWFNVESPEFCTVTDLNKRNPIVLERAEPIPAMDASSDDFDRDRASKRSLTRPVIEYYSSLKCEKPELRKHFPNAEITLECLSEESQREAIKERRKNESLRVTQAKAAGKGIIPKGEDVALTRQLGRDPQRHAKFLGFSSAFEELNKETRE